MRVYNPTPWIIDSKHGGVAYYVEPGMSIAVGEDTGKWILERWAKDGLVCIDPPAKTGKKGEACSLKKHIITKALEGLIAKRETLHKVVESYLTADTEMKSNNQNATILKSRDLRARLQDIEDVTNLISEIEKTHGVSLQKEDYTAKKDLIFASIDAQIAEFDADTERQEKAASEEREIQKTIDSVLKGVVKGPTAVGPVVVG